MNLLECSNKNPTILQTNNDSVEGKNLNDKNNKESSKNEESTTTEGGLKLGRVKWFNQTKGWGFIEPVAVKSTNGDEKNGSKNTSQNENTKVEDVFVYQSAIQMSGFRKLTPNQLVRYETKQTDKGLEATVVVPHFPSAATRILGLETHRLEIDFGRLFLQQQPRDRTIKCYNCGKLGHHKASRCKADKGVVDANGTSNGNGNKEESNHQKSSIDPSKLLDTRKMFEQFNLKTISNDSSQMATLAILKRCHRCRSPHHLVADCTSQKCPLEGFRSNTKDVNGSVFKINLN